MLNRRLSPGNRHQTAQAGLAGQQIVEGIIEPILGNVQPDREQPALRVIEKPQVHLIRKLAGPAGQRFNQGDGLPSAGAAG